MELINQVWQKIINGYWPAYYDWLTEKLDNIEPFTLLIYAVMATFVLVVYVWFRNR